MFFLACRALQDLLQQTPAHWRACIAAIAIAGTTTTSLLVDRHNGNMLADPVLYNQPQSLSITTAAQVQVIATASCDSLRLMQLVAFKA